MALGGFLQPLVALERRQTGIVALAIDESKNRVAGLAVAELAGVRLAPPLASTGLAECI